MINIRRYILTGILNILISIGGYTQEPVFVKGSQVCFIGNSITYMGGFHHDIALFYATRFPLEKIDIYNCGVGGNMAANVITRMDSDILVRRPDWSVLKLGMNDVHRELYTRESNAQPGIAQKRQQVLDVYRINYEKIIKTLLQHNSKIILQTPTIYDQTAILRDNESLWGRNEALKICAGYVKEFGKKYHLPVVDYWTILDSLTRKVQATDSAITLIGPDRVHPGATGHFIMAYAFLKAMQPNTCVSVITIDAGKKRVTVQNGKSSGFTAGKDAMRFTCFENALPFPVLSEAAPACKLVPFTNELNKEWLQVKQLRDGNYKVTIDNILIGTYSARQLQQGINLAQNERTPQFVQAAKVLELFREYWSLEVKTRYVRALETGRFWPRKIFTIEGAENYFNTQLTTLSDTSTAYKDMARLRDSYLPAKKQEAAMLQQMENLHSRIYESNKPVAHIFEITRDH